MIHASQLERRPLARIVLAGVVLLQVPTGVPSFIVERTPVGTWLFLDHLWQEAATKHLEWSGTLAACTGSVIAVTMRQPIARLLGAGIASAWCLALALCAWKMGGAPFTELSLGA